MAKAIAVLWLALAASSAWADAVALDFRGIKVGELAEVVSRTVLKRDFVLSPEVAGMDQRLTLSVRSVDRAEVLDLLRSTLAGAGVGVADRGAVLYFAKEERAPAGAFAPGADMAERLVSPAKPSAADDIEVAHYFPRHRSVEFLSMAVRVTGASVAGNQAGQGMQMGFYGSMPMPMPQPQAQQQAQKHQDALVYAGSAKVLERARKLLADLDRPMGAVTIKAAVLEVSAGSDGAQSLTAVLGALAGRLGVSYGPATRLGNGVTWSGVNLSAVLSAVEGDNHFRYLAEPILRVVDGETARLVVGSDVPVRGAISTDKNGQTIQSIEYRTAGVVVTVSPKVLADVIRLDIGQQISSFSQTTTSGIDSPTMNKREASTVVDAKDGDLIVLAGMDEERETATSTGLSFLPSFLWSRSNTKARSQIVLLLEVRRV
jgi:hypothetical protein